MRDANGMNLGRYTTYQFPTIELFLSCPHLARKRFIVKSSKPIFQPWRKKRAPLTAFGLAIVFIIIVSSVILINRQMNFIRNQDLGFDLKNTVSVMLFDVQERTQGLARP